MKLTTNLIYNVKMYIAIVSWVDLFHIGEEQTDNF